MTEEEQCEDLLLFLKLLSHLTTKDYLNFAPDDDSAEEASLCKVEPVDVMVTGVSIVLPLMSEETLKVEGVGLMCEEMLEVEGLDGWVGGLRDA